MISDRDFQNLTKYKTFFYHSETFPGARDPTQNLGPIGSAVLTFIGYKQTDRQAKCI